MLYLLVTLNLALTAYVAWTLYVKLTVVQRWAVMHDSQAWDKVYKIEKAELEETRQKLRELKR